jgi:hypothetical protein
MRKICFALLTISSLSAYAYDYKTAEEVCGKVNGIISSASHEVNASDGSSKYKALSLTEVNGKGSYSLVFDVKDFETKELHEDAKEMANTALANRNLEICLKGTTKNKEKKNGTWVYGFKWVQVRLRAKN